MNGLATTIADMRRFRTIFSFLAIAVLVSSEELDKQLLKQRAHELFMHGYRSYMNLAYPADELMPLSCKGRYRGVTPSRGDVDDSLGNFSLTLVDSLDTLIVVGELNEFESAVKKIVDDVRFDSDIIVSVFETNIRILGGLLSGHIMAEIVRNKIPGKLAWYNDRQLLKKAVDIADRLLPAFNTTSGIPYSRINLRHGMLPHLVRQKDTCTACGGTMLLEMAALSRMTGNPVYEQKARKAMDFLWAQRHRASDLMGTVLNVHSGDWVRRESGIGAGIDSYYEYCLKAYILLGDDTYLDRFNAHYDAVMKYVNKGPLFVDVHMHRPTVATRSFMDSLLAFWPGLQVLKGDVKEAIEMHEMLFQVVKKHKFLPEAFTHDFQVHWAEHPLRPEFIESTYFLYRATKDPYYLQVAKQVMDSIEQYVKVPCGFAGVKDVRTMSHEDRMDSFVLSETFKYLYMIFAEPNEFLFDPDNFVLTTEAHFLPLSIGAQEHEPLPRRVFMRPDDTSGDETEFVSANPITLNHRITEVAEAQRIRERTKMVLEELFTLQQQASSQPQCVKPSERLRAWAFSAQNQEHIKALRQMGIDIRIQEDGRMQFSHQASNAETRDFAKWGFEFMQEVAAYAAQLEKEGSNAFEQRADRYVQILSPPFYGLPIMVASPAQFGLELFERDLIGNLAVAEPYRACSQLTNPKEIMGKIAIVERSDCMFQEKSRYAQQAGAIGVIVVDHIVGTSAAGQPSFAMAGDKDSPDDIGLPALFIYNKEGRTLLRALKENPQLVVRMAADPLDENVVVEDFLRSGAQRPVPWSMQCAVEDGYFFIVDKSIPGVVFRFRFEGVNQQSDPAQHQEIVERHVTQFEKAIEINGDHMRHTFFNFVRNVAYSTLGLNVEDDDLQPVSLSLGSIAHVNEEYINQKFLRGPITQVRCLPKDTKMECVTITTGP